MAIDGNQQASGDVARQVSILSAAALSGAGTMIVEVAAPRLLQPYFGSSVFVWTNLIAVVMTALALGYYAGSRRAARDGYARFAALMLTAAAILAAAAPFLVRHIAGFLLPDAEALAATIDSAGILRISSLLAAVFLFALPIYLLATTSPVYVRMLADLGLRAEASAGRALCAGTIGSLLGTLLPTYVLVPFIGSRGTFALAAICLVLAALLIDRSGKRRALAAAGALVLLGAATSSLGSLRPELAGERLLAEVETPYQYLRVTEAKEADGKLLRSLRINEGVLEYHSVGIAGTAFSGGRYYDTLALAPAYLPAERRLRAAILGGGAGTAARLFVHAWPGRFESIDDVEIDSGAAALADLIAENGPPPPVERRVRAMDGRAFLALTRDEFDIVVVDAYSQQTDIPFHMATVEFFREAADSLVDDGLIVLNVSAVDVDSRLMKGLLGALAHAFADAHILPVRGYPNAVVAARKKGLLGDPSNLPKELEETARAALRARTTGALGDKALALTDDRAPTEFLTAIAGRD